MEEKVILAVRAIGHAQDAKEVSLHLQDPPKDGSVEGAGYKQCRHSCSEAQGTLAEAETPEHGTAKDKNDKRVLQRQPRMCHTEECGSH